MFKKTLFLLSIFAFISSLNSFSTFSSYIFNKIVKPAIIEPDPLFQSSSEKYFCINGRNSENLTQKQQLEEFIKGPCSPIIIVPGILGTSLRVEIDCGILKTKNPEIFSSCGWETCSPYQFWLSKPEAEYKLWLTDLLSPLSMFSMLESSHKCFNELIQINFNESSINEEERYSSPKGVKITWDGNTKLTKESNECGAAAIQELSGAIHLGCQTEGFGKFIKSLENLGYQNSISFQALPYDFRKGVIYNDFNALLKRAIGYLYDLTGKKVTIIGHSLGNNHILHAFNTMDQVEKDQMVFEYIAIGPPFTGTLNSLQAELSGFKEFQFENVIGLSFNAQKSFLGSPSLYECLPFDTFERFKDEEWMNEIIERIEQEKKFPANSEIGREFWTKNNFSLNWFPSPIETCGNNLDQEKKCSTNLIDFSKEALVKIGNKEFFTTKEDLFDLIRNYSAFQKEPLKIYQSALENKLNLLQNPNVPTTIIYSSLLNTTKRINYKINPQEQTIKKNEFFWDEELIYGKGDGNMLSSSILVPASKWIWELKNQTPNAKPIKVYEMCSNYENSQNNSHDSIFSGYECKCLKNNEIKNCIHSCLISDSGVIDLIFQRIKKHPKIEKNRKLLEINYESLEEKCYALTLSVQVSNITHFIKSLE